MKRMDMMSGIARVLVCTMCISLFSAVPIKAEKKNQERFVEVTQETTDEENQTEEINEDLEEAVVSNEPADKKNLSEVEAEQEKNLLGKKAKESIDSKCQIGNYDEESLTSTPQSSDEEREESADGSYVKSSAAKTGIVEGSCGENVTYTWNADTGELVVSGTGAMADYEELSDSPFYTFAEEIQRVTVQEGVTALGMQAFTFCFNLEWMELPDSLTSIGKWALVGCSSLDMLYVPSSVTDIGAYGVGYDCNNGRDGKFVDSGILLLGEEGSYVQSYASENYLGFMVDAGLTGHCGENANWSMDIDTKTLTISGSGDMTDYGKYDYPEYKQYQYLIQNVVIEPGITGVGQYAFYNYTELKNVQMGENVTKIGKGAFEECKQLFTLQMSDAIITIEDSAFYGCCALESVSLPANLSSLGEGVFVSCYSLQKYSISSANETFAVVDGVLYSKNNGTIYKLVSVPGAYPKQRLVVPDTVKYIAQRCIYASMTLNTIVFCGSGVRFTYYRDYQEVENFTVYYKDDGNWGDLQEQWENRNVNWIEMTDLVGVNHPTIQAETTSVNVGERMQLFMQIDPTLVEGLQWESENEDVAVVSDDGCLLAINPGTTTVKVSGTDNQYIAQIDITVSGNAFSLSDKESQLLDETLVDYDSTVDVIKQIVSEKLHGIYFLNNRDLEFYSLVSDTYEHIYTFDSCEDAYEANDKLYVLGVDNKYYVYNLITQSLETYGIIIGKEAYSIGADYQGRIYFAGSKIKHVRPNKMWLCDAEGEELSEITTGKHITDFSGFDEENGYFFMEGCHDYYSWGYSHEGSALLMGKVENDHIKYVETYYGFTESGIISRSMSCLMYLCQYSWMYHQPSAQMIGNRYLAATSVLHGRLDIYDTRSATDGQLACKLRINRSAFDTGDEGSAIDFNSIGTRTIYKEESDSVVLYENNNTLSEYSLKTGDKIATRKTSERVFNLLEYGGYVIAIEKGEAGYSMEIMEWKQPSDIILSLEKKNMRVGEVQMIKASSDVDYELFYEWTSSNPKVVSVDKEGKIAAWKEGTADITATTGDISRTLTVTVSQSVVENPKENVTVLQGAGDSNISANDYSVWSTPVYSYMIQNADNSLTMIEAMGKEGVQVKTCLTDGTNVNTMVLQKEMDLFGGFYSGADANYLVFGSDNTLESDDAEVIKVVKYSKDWNRLGAVSIKGINTYSPFDAGSLRMAEVNGSLYIHTCHTMYDSGDGYHHQANMTFVIDEVNMTVLQSYYDVMNLAQAGYVSHSFNQFVQTDGTYVYRVDHGDANPRAITLTQCDVDGKITNVSYRLLHQMRGSSNYTGVSVGGFELSSDSCLVVGNSVDQDSQGGYDSGQRNIFVSVTSKDLLENRTIWLTEYDGDANIKVKNPQLVKLNDSQFLVMWEEYNENTKKRSVKVTTISSNGIQTTDVMDANLLLSDCQPIRTSDGLVRWFVSDGSLTRMFTLNPFDIGALKGMSEEEMAGYATKEDWSQDDEDNRTQDDGDDGYIDEDYISDDNNKKTDYTGNLKQKSEKVFGRIYTDVYTGEQYRITSDTEAQYYVGKHNAKKVTIPDTVKLDGKEYKITSICERTFQNEKKLTSIKIGKNVKRINASAFENCRKLSKVTGGKGLVKIGKKAFKGCISLKNITLYSNLVMLDSQAFYGCKKLKKVIIKSKKLKKVGKNAMKGTPKKQQIVTPKGKEKSYKKLLKK